MCTLTINHEHEWSTHQFGPSCQTNIWMMIPVSNSKREKKETGNSGDMANVCVYNNIYRIKLNGGVRPQNVFFWEKREKRKHSLMNRNGK